MYLADKSALARARHPDVGRRLKHLLDRNQLVTCAIVDLELLYSARHLDDFEAMWEARSGLPRVPIDDGVFARAHMIQHRLAKVGQHRRPIPDVIIAAAAISAGVPVLHYDQDFAIIAEHTPLEQEWIVTRGTCD